MNNFLGHDGLAPVQLLSRARAMLQPLDVTIKQDRAVDAEPMPGGGWLVRGRSGQRWEARAVLLATGLLDGLPDIPGLAPLWGSSVVACPHCHGWELRGEPLAQMGLPGTVARTVERALLLSRWSQDVVLLTQGEELDDDQVTHLRRASVAVETRERVGVARTADQLTLTLADGDCLDRRAIFVSPGQRQPDCPGPAAGLPGARRCRGGGPRGGSGRPDERPRRLGGGHDGPARVAGHRCRWRGCHGRRRAARRLARGRIAARGDG